MIEVLKQALDAFHQIFESTPVYHNDGTCIINDKSVELSNKATASLRQAIAELESQEPVATVTSETGADITMSWWHEPALPVGSKLYTHPPQRTWQGLTDEDIKTICSENGWDSSWQSLRFAQAIEAKLKEKNT